MKIMGINASLPTKINLQYPNKNSAVKVLMCLLLLAAIPVVNATYANESIEMITFPVGDLEYQGFVYSADMCNALDCYRSYEMML